jgi:hypothetical protein
MPHRFLVPLVALLVGLGFVAAAPASAEDPPAEGTGPTPVKVEQLEPILFQVYGAPPHGGLPNLTPHPTMEISAGLRTDTGTLPEHDVAGETIVFSIGARPTASRPGGTLEICRATTASNGAATCAGGNASTALLLGILGLGVWASHPATEPYGFAVERLDLVGLFCSNPFC